MTILLLEPWNTARHKGTTIGGKFTVFSPMELHLHQHITVDSFNQTYVIVLCNSSIVLYFCINKWMNANPSSQKDATDLLGGATLMMTWLQGAGGMPLFVGNSDDREIIRMR